MSFSRISLWCEQVTGPDDISSALEQGITLFFVSSTWERALTSLAVHPEAKIALILGQDGYGRLSSELSEALERLRRSEVELLMLFYPEPEQFVVSSPFDFVRAQKGGVARQVALMARDQGSALLTRRLGFDLCCLHHNWFRREQGIEFFPIARSQDIPAISLQVLRGSRLDSPQVKALSELHPGRSLSALALGYCLHEPAVVSACIEVGEPVEVAELDEKAVRNIERVVMGLPAKT